MPITIPNLLSLMRMGLTPLFIISVVNGQPVSALVIFGVAGITDALDGFIARKLGQQSRLGAYLDPIADKLLLMSAYVMLAIPGLHHGAHIPPWVTVLVIARDLIIVIVALILYLALGVRKFPPSQLSKLNTVVQVVTAFMVVGSGVFEVLVTPAEWLAYLVGATTLSSGIHYIILANRWATEAARKDSASEPPPAS